MNSFTPVIILILVVLIQVLMRLSPNVFAIFWHSAIAKKTVKKAERFGLYYILGTETITTLALFGSLTTFTLIFASHTFISKIFLWVLFGILIALSITFFFFYFKRKSTRLFISRRTASYFTKKAESIKTRRSAYTLGLLTSLCELPFTFPLYILAGLTSIIKTDSSITPSLPNAAILVTYIVISALPLLMIYSHFHSGHTLADYQRLQEKTKFLTRIVVSVVFLALAMLIFNLGLNS